MVVGVALVFVRARKLPAKVATPVPVAPVMPPVPVPTALPLPPNAGQVPPLGASVSPRRPVALPVTILPFPEDASAAVPVEAGHPLWGNRDASVTITVFADLECAPSIAMLRELLRLKARAGDDVRLAFRHLPLSQHAEGLRAARALAQIHTTRGEQAFWHALAAIVRHGEPLSAGVLATLLDTAGLGGFPLDAPVARAEAALASDAELGALLFVRDTPTVFVNGKRFSGFVPRPLLDEAVERERRAVTLLLASGVAPSRVYAERARKNLLNLGDDPPPRSCVPSEDAPAFGPSAAAVTVVEFTDLECELCRQGEASLSSALKPYASEVRVVWRNFPLPQHHRARLAAGVALAARSAAGDAAFFSVTRALFAPRVLVDDQSLSDALSRNGLDAAALLSASKAGSYEATLQNDIQLAEKLGVNGAPTYFVNGYKVAGALPPAEFTALLAREVALGRRVRAQGSGSVAELACGVRNPSNAVKDRR